MSINGIVCIGGLMSHLEFNESDDDWKGMYVDTQDVFLKNGQAPMT